MAGAGVEGGFVDVGGRVGEEEFARDVVFEDVACCAGFVGETLACAGESTSDWEVYVSQYMDEMLSWLRTCVRDEEVLGCNFFTVARATVLDISTSDLDTIRAFKHASRDPKSD